MISPHRLWGAGRGVDLVVNVRFLITEGDHGLKELRQSSLQAVESV